WPISPAQTPSTGISKVAHSYFFGLRFANLSPPKATPTHTPLTPSPQTSIQARPWGLRALGHYFITPCFISQTPLPSGKSKNRKFCFGHSPTPRCSTPLGRAAPPSLTPGCEYLRKFK